jgi:hypothetical protein
MMGIHEEDHSRDGMRTEIEYCEVAWNRYRLRRSAMSFKSLSRSL